MKIISLLNKNIQRFCSKIHLQLTPHQLWLTQGNGMERPFTGDKWFNKDVGTYHCIVCDNHIFNSDQKIFVPSGIASFYNFQKGTIHIQDQNDLKIDVTNIQKMEIKENLQGKQCQCQKVFQIQKCKANLGAVFMDGPPPTFLRFSMNSGFYFIQASLEFKLKPWFQDPNIKKQEKKQNNIENKLKEKKVLKLKKDFKDSQLKYDEKLYEKSIEKSKKKKI